MIYEKIQEFLKDEQVENEGGETSNHQGIFDKVYEIICEELSVI